jgi:hypothetical protein
MREFVFSAIQRIVETNIESLRHDGPGSALKFNLTHEHQILDG